MKNLTNRRGILLGLTIFLCCSAVASAGAFVFASDINGLDLITHPQGYTGAPGVVSVSVCIDPASSSAAAVSDINDLIIPVTNVVATWNALSALTPNLSIGGSNNIPSSQVDFESVILHEVGHCIGLAHPNHATESGLVDPPRNGTKSTEGANSVFDQGAGVDGLHGSFDDVRGDDANLHWFQSGVNNPMMSVGSGIYDASTYTISLASLPSGHLFAANSDRSVNSSLGFSDSEATMQQGQFFDEAQRAISFDDEATLRLAMSGLDETQNTGDDYTLQLTYAGITSSCDIPITVVGSSFAFCSIGGDFVGSHAAVSSAFINVSATSDWFFNQEVAPLFLDGFESGNTGRWSSEVP